uniref:Uncharacterized protein n=1 Tax=Rhizophagus irregularis (strain DAOM 181602 / DAOM 197198 / MUCL 43194) TaxID=747089 RepID=U9TUP3_RHIID
MLSYCNSYGLSLPGLMTRLKFCIKYGIGTVHSVKLVKAQNKWGINNNSTSKVEDNRPKLG